jgi:hypothetical protein
MADGLSNGVIWSRWAFQGLLGVPLQPLSPQWLKKNRVHLEGQASDFPVREKDWVIQKDGGRSRVMSIQSSGPILLPRNWKIQQIGPLTLIVLPEGGQVVLQGSGQTWEIRKISEQQVWKARRGLSNRMLLISIIFTALAIQIIDANIQPKSSQFLKIVVEIPAFLICGTLWAVWFAGMVARVRYARGSQDVAGPMVFDPDPKQTAKDKRTTPSPYRSTEAETI